jgi:hypothetical protein
VHASTQAGRSPRRVRSRQPSHFSARPVRGCTDIAPKGHTIPHMKHPWQRSESTKTTPDSASWVMAEFGQAVTQGGFVQWTQRSNRA